MIKYLDPKKYIIKISLRLSNQIALWEKRMVAKYGRQPIKHQPVFIIGAPRTGSTILYQLITNRLDVLYMDNLTCIFRKNFFYGFWLSNKLFRQKAHNCFKSNLGNTSEFGLRAPSECGGYWYRWLPKNHHFIDYDEITDQMVNEIRQEITAVSNYFDKPIVFKNLNAGQRIRLLSKCFPAAKFIFIKRSPLLTAQSIFTSRSKLDIPKGVMWSIKPRNFKDLEKLELPELIIQQIYHLERQIYIDKNLVKEENFLQINYEDLAYKAVIERIKSFIHTNSRKNVQEMDIEIKETLKLTSQEKAAFTEHAEKLDWKTYGLS